LDDSSKIPFHERDTGAMHGHIGSGAHGDAHISRSERGSVVDTVASHRHDAFARFELKHSGLFLRRSSLGHNLVNTEPAGNLTSGLLVVAGQHDDLEAGAM
jgi:hypothetical protein